MCAHRSLIVLFPHDTINFSNTILNSCFLTTDDGRAWEVVSGSFRSACASVLARSSSSSPSDKPFDLLSGARTCQQDVQTTAARVCTTRIFSSSSSICFAIFISSFIASSLLQTSPPSMMPTASTTAVWPLVSRTAPSPTHTTSANWWRFRSDHFDIGIVDLPQLHVPRPGGTA